MGNVEAKELICTTHGRELRRGGGGDAGGGCKAEGNKEEEKWNCISIIDKICFKKINII